MKQILVRFPAWMMYRESGEIDLPASLVLLELGGAAGIELDLPLDASPERIKDWQRIRDGIRLPVGVRIPPTREALGRALALKPHRITLARFDEYTSALPLQLSGDKTNLQDLIRTLSEQAIPVSLVLEPEMEQLKTASKLHAKGIEFIMPPHWDSISTELNDFVLAAWKVGVGVVAGVTCEISQLGRAGVIRELSAVVAGDSFWSRALLIGIERTLKGMKDALV